MLVDNGYTRLVQDAMDQYVELLSTIHRLSEELWSTEHSLSFALLESFFQSEQLRQLGEQFEDLSSRFGLLNALQTDTTNRLSLTSTALAAMRAGMRVDGHYIDMLEAQVAPSVRETTGESVRTAVQSQEVTPRTRGEVARVAPLRFIFNVELAERTRVAIARAARTVEENRAWRLAEGLPLRPVAEGSRRHLILDSATPRGYHSFRD